VKEGIVLRAVSGVYTVQSSGRVVHCTLRGNLKKEFQYSTSASLSRKVIRARRPYNFDTVSVGDRVRFVESHHGAGVIEEVLPRRTRFTRAGFRGQEQTIVCNLDQLCIVFAAVEPRPDPWKLDRFLVAAEAESIRPLIVANKADLVPEEELRSSFAGWERIGYRVLPTSAQTGAGLDMLREALREKVSACVGPSGVGKSSLLNAIQPGLNLRTAEIGYITYKGRHTTTAAQLIPLRSGGWVADTPGLRQMELLDMERSELAECFPEFRPHLGRCRFDDCRHDSEPGCAVRAAVQSGEISQRRYESFLILAGERN
jgi:ribosome biogenesis GTPase